MNAPAKIDITVNHVIIHELIKAKNTTTAELKPRDAALDIKLEVVAQLAKGVVDLYNKRKDAVQYGVFKSDDAYRIPDYFKKYIDVPNENYEPFTEFSKVAMRELKREAETQSASSGGILVFIDYYNSKKNRFFLIAMMKQKKGFHLSSTLELEDVEHLDLGRLYQAVSINFERYKQYQSIDKNQQVEMNYLNYINPSQSKKISGYFVRALGCKESCSSSQATRGVYKQTKNFFKQEPDLEQYAKDAGEQVKQYLASKVEQKQPARLLEIADIAKSYFPKEDPKLTEQLTEHFISHLNSESVGVPAVFNVSKDAVHNMIYLSVKQEGLSMDIDRQLLGTSDKSKYQYLSESGHVLVKLTDESREQVKECLGIK